MKARAGPPEVDGLIDPAASAEEAGLRYVTDEEPGFSRRQIGGEFRFLKPDGRILRDAAELRRIRSLAVPPAWTDVWICLRGDGHLQATGRDARGRKQYRYHPRWREVRDSVKYGRMLKFVAALPRIRRRVARDLSRRALNREKVLATVVRLLELTLIRIGNEEYAQANQSFGLSTMRNRHVDIRGPSIHFHFRGKAGKKHSIRIADRRLARTISRLQDMPGQKLFQFETADGARHEVESGDVNAYLREASGEEFTAKDFRTWAGTVLAAMALHELRDFDSDAQAKRNVVAAVERVAAQLGNTPAICRKCYVHPEVIETYLEGALALVLRDRAETRIRERLDVLRPEEAAVLALLRQRLAGKPRAPRGRQRIPGR